MWSEMLPDLPGVFSTGSWAENQRKSTTIGRQKIQKQTPSLTFSQIKYPFQIPFIQKSNTTFPISNTLADPEGTNFLVIRVARHILFRTVGDQRSNMFFTCFLASGHEVFWFGDRKSVEFYEAFWFRGPKSIVFYKVF